MTLQPKRPLLLLYCRTNSSNKVEAPTSLVLIQEYAKLSYTTESDSDICQRNCSVVTPGYVGTDVPGFRKKKLVSMAQGVLNSFVINRHTYFLKLAYTSLHLIAS